MVAKNMKPQKYEAVLAETKITLQVLKLRHYHSLPSGTVTCVIYHREVFQTILINTIAFLAT
jgi:hypothetical protein